jgi:hypothetical protein
MSKLQKSLSQPSLSKFIVFLSDHNTEFSKLTPKQQYYFAYGVAAIKTGKLENHSFQGSYCLFYKPRYKIFDSNEAFWEANTSLGIWFNKDHKGVFGGGDGVADGWSLSEEPSRLFDLFMEGVSPETLKPSETYLDQTKPRYQNGISNKPKFGEASAFKNIKIPHKIPINLDEVQELKRIKLLCADKRSKEVVKACDYILSNIFIDPKSTQPYMSIQYTQYQSGRLFTQDKSLQNLCREAKAAALKGCFDYDIENCHYEIFRQLTDRIGIQTPQMDFYCLNKSLFRNRLAERNQTSVKAAKIVLLSLIYGAKLSKDKRLSIFQSIYKEGILSEEEITSTVDKLQKDPEFREFIRELKMVKAPVFEKHKSWSNIHYDNMVFNIFGTRKPCGQNPDNESMAHIIQGYEAEMLRVVLKEVGDDIRLIQHDGFVSAKKLDVKALENSIEKHTGFRIKITETEL